MRAPNFFIIGAQKAGTTYLAKVLSNHPDVFFSEPKEALFFSKPGVTSGAYQEYLREFFANAKGEKWVGEGSTTYLQWPGALDSLKSHVGGDLRFIVCLRHPLEKAVSFYIHNWRRGRYAPGTRISQTVSLPLTLSPLLTSKYADSIGRWLGAYSRHRFCFLTFDLLQENPSEFVAAAARFLDISTPETVIKKQVNAGFKLKWIGEKLVIDDPSAPADDRPEFSRDELEDFHSLLKDDIVRTEGLTGLNLDHWKQFPAFA